MSNKDSRKIRRKVKWWIGGACTTAALISITDIIAAWQLGPGMPAWFISITAAAVVAWFAAGTGVAVWCFQRIAERTAKALKQELRVEVEKVSEGLREVLRKDLEAEALLRAADQWEKALQSPGENVRHIGRG